MAPSSVHLTPNFNLFGGEAQAKFSFLIDFLRWDLPAKRPIRVPRSRIFQIFSMNKLVLGNVLHRPLRTMISVVAVAIEVIMILSIVAIMVGMVSNARSQTGGIGGDIIVRPPNASFISSVGGAPVPAKIADVLRKLPHVAAAAPTIADFNMAGGVETIWGIDFDSYDALKPFVFIAGGPFQGPNDVIVDDLYARSARSEERRVGKECV